MSALVENRNYYDEILASSDSDDYHKVFYSSSSHDRSSVGSIPWAEDAIKQNQQAWERIERIFYGEEDLPGDDQELRREIIEWTTAFPHLRIVGEKLMKPEESQAIDESNADMQYSKGLPKSERAFDKSFIIHPEAKSVLLDSDFASLLERDLRINSVPMLSKRRQFIDANVFQNEATIWTKPISRAFLQRNPSAGKYVRRQIFPSDPAKAIVSTVHGANNGVGSKIAATSSKSARIVRMPPIINFILPSQNKYLSPGSAATHLLFSTANPKGARKIGVTPKPHEPIVLPVLKVARPELSEEDVSSRSISAAVNERKLRALYWTSSASKLKIAK